jgi:hypothetical protein
MKGRPTLVRNPIAKSPCTGQTSILLADPLRSAIHAPEEQPPLRFRSVAPSTNDSIHRRGAQTAFIRFSTFLDLRPVSAANVAQTLMDSQLEILSSNRRTPLSAALVTWGLPTGLCIQRIYKPTKEAPI